MKIIVKQRWRIAVLGCLAGVCVAVLVPKAQASPTDTMTVSVTPSVTFAVQISSPELAGYDFSTVALRSDDGVDGSDHAEHSRSHSAQFFGLSSLEHGRLMVVDDRRTREWTRSG